MAVEQEVKLVFESPEAARRAVTTAGGRLVSSRRLLVDTLFDTAEQHLRQRRCALRVRRDGDHALVTFKGPVQAGPVKSREEIETPVGSADAADALLHALGYRPWFRSEKYREDYELGAARLTVDETPIGVFVEIEATPVEIERVAAHLDRTPADYRLESYPTLYARWCEERGRTRGDMTFGRE